MSLGKGKSGKDLFMEMAEKNKAQFPTFDPVASQMPDLSLPGNPAQYSNPTISEQQNALDVASALGGMPGYNQAFMNRPQQAPQSQPVPQDQPAPATSPMDPVSTVPAAYVGNNFSAGSANAAMAYVPQTPGMTEQQDPQARFDAYAAYERPASPMDQAFSLNPSALKQSPVDKMFSATPEEKSMKDSILKNDPRMTGDPLRDISIMETDINTPFDQNPPEVQQSLSGLENQFRLSDPQTDNRKLPCSQDDGSTFQCPFSNVPCGRRSFWSRIGAFFRKLFGIEDENTFRANIQQENAQDPIALDYSIQKVTSPQSQGQSAPLQMDLSGLAPISLSPRSVNSAPDSLSLN